MRQQDMRDLDRISPTKVPNRWGSILGLFGKPLATFRAAWELRGELAGPKRLSDEMAFLPAALSLQETPIHPAPRRLAIGLIVLFLIAICWACLGKVDIVAVAPGRIIVAERTKLIQPLERSVVRKILVKEGDRVEARQALVELDRTNASADRVSTDEQLKTSQSELMRTRALLTSMNDGTKPRLEGVGQIAHDWSPFLIRRAEALLASEWNDITAKLAKITAEIDRRNAEILTSKALIAKIENGLIFAIKREADYKELADRGLVSIHESEDRVRVRTDLERDLMAQRARLAEAEVSAQESKRKRTAYLAETRRDLLQRETVSELKNQQGMQELAKANQRELLATLTSPVTGIVQQLAANTEGGVITEAQPIMVIVPEHAEVTAEVALENKDIGFVNIDQDAEIKLETFPFMRYGTVEAKVKSITADAINDEKAGRIFTVILRLTKDSIEVDGKRVKLSPGMNIQAEIKTGERSIIEFLLGPIARATKEGLRER